MGILCAPKMGVGRRCGAPHSPADSSSGVELVWGVEARSQDFGLFDSEARSRRSGLGWSGRSLQGCAAGPARRFPADRLAGEHRCCIAILGAASCCVFACGIDELTSEMMDIGVLESMGAFEPPDIDLCGDINM